jgi:hypothetical protein
MFIIVLGSAVFGGLRFFGPFESIDDARCYAEHVLPLTTVGSWDITSLERSGDAMDYKAQPIPCRRAT